MKMYSSRERVQPPLGVWWGPEADKMVVLNFKGKGVGIY